jgi:hypothetical protein
MLLALCANMREVINASIFLSSQIAFLGVQSPAGTHHSEPGVMFLILRTNMRQLWSTSCSLVNHSSDLELSRSSWSELILWETERLASDQLKEEAKECEYRAQVGLELHHDQLIRIRCSFSEVEARCDCGCLSKEADQVINEGKRKSY